MIKISVFLDGNPITEFEQASGGKEITIGRASGCVIPLDEPSISRLHALIRFQGSQWILERKANFGAVLLNGQEVENAPLEGGEEVSVGKYVLRIDIDGDSASAGSSLARPEEDGRTKFVSTGVNALFRFEPGSANLTEYLMQKDLVIFGRGTNCDVILTEKRASRKHCEIRKQGLSFFLKDLGSSNGTEVNGRKVEESELVPGDVIQIGESKFQFTIENKEFFAKQDEFLPVPSHLENYLEPSSGHSAALGQNSFESPSDGLGSQGIPGIDPISTSADEPQSLVGKLRKRYLAMNQRQRLISIGVAFIFITSVLSTLLGDPNEDEKKKPRAKPKIVNGQVVRTIDFLTPERRKLVLVSYKALLAAYEKRDYATMLDLTGKILTHVDEYKDTVSYQSIANKGIAEAEEAKRTKELKDKQDKIRAEVATLEGKGKSLFSKALDDLKARPELNSLIEEIYSKDPNNRLAQEWKKGIKEKEEQEKAEAEMAKAKDQLRDKAEQEFEAVEKIFAASKYVEALAEADKLDALGVSDKSYLDKVDGLKSRIKEKLSSVLTPLLQEATSQRAEGGDLVKAKEAYLQVLKIDSSNKEAQQGLSAIRETLHTRAKRFYAEAILAESVSDLLDAKDKYEKCLRSAPEEDIYKRRCKTKLNRFEGFSGG